MRAKEFISEAKGLFGRNIGDKFINDNGVEAQFQGIDIFPSTEPNATFNSPEEMQATIDSLETKNKTSIEWVNKPNRATGAFAVSSFRDTNNKLILWGRWYSKVPGVLTGTWKNTELPPGWKLAIKSAVKARSGLTPQDLIKTSNKFTSANEIISTVEKNGAPLEIVNGLKMIANGRMPVFKNMKDSEPAIRDHLGEIIQALALMSGLIKSDAEKARAEILHVPWADCSVYWPMNKIYNLVDCVFSNPSTGETLGVSTKGDKGANPSVGNIYNAIYKAEQKGNTKLLNNYKDVIDIIKIIATTSAKEGPLILATNMGLITDQLSKEISGLVKITTSDISRLSPEAKKLFSMYGSNSSKSGFNVGFVLLSNVAKMVADKVNNDPTFSEACLAFLNQASIIQIYTTTSIQGNDVVVSGFRAVYPPNYTGRVIMDAGKNYFSTEIKGKMTFSMPKGK